MSLFEKIGGMFGTKSRNVIYLCMDGESFETPTGKRIPKIYALLTKSGGDWVTGRGFYPSELANSIRGDVPKEGVRVLNYDDVPEKEKEKMKKSLGRENLRPMKREYASTFRTILRGLVAKIEE